MGQIEVRLARPDEAAALTELAMRSKASWGYSDEFMAACRAELTFTPETMAVWTVWVAELDGEVAGMVALHMDGADAELENFFVEPDLQGQGIGAALMKVFTDTARDRGARTVGLDADPNAEAIYQRRGFTTVGRSPSGSIPGRFLPRMELRL